MLKNTAKVFRKTTGTGQAIENWREIGEIRCLIVSISFTEGLLGDLAQLKIDYKMYILPEADIKNGDKILSLGQNYIVQKIDNICQMNKVVECLLTKL